MLMETVYWMFSYRTEKVVSSHWRFTLPNKTKLKTITGLFKECGGYISKMSGTFCFELKKNAMIPLPVTTYDIKMVIVIQIHSQCRIYLWAR
jgi:hypothetical protein